MNKKTGRFLISLITGFLVILSTLLTGCNSSDKSKTDKKEKYKKMEGNVVVFGDSIWALDKGPKGVAGRFEELTSFNVTDLSVCGGMAVRIEKYPSTHSNSCLTSMLFFNEDEESKEMRDSIMGSDYVILEYGGNDYPNASVPASGEGNSFENAMQKAVAAIKEMNPDARIVLIGPSEGWFKEDDRIILRSEAEIGGCTLKDFSNAVRNVAEKEGILWVDMMKGIPFSAETPREYVIDGAHLSDAGSQVYAEYLTEQIYNYYYVSD
jgi:lysophospholipase L1-like esterase